MKIETFRKEQRRCCYNCYYHRKTTNSIGMAYDECTTDTDLDLDHPECSVCDNHEYAQERRNENEKPQPNLQTNTGCKKFPTNCGYAETTDFCDHFCSGYEKKKPEKRKCSCCGLVS